MTGNLIIRFIIRLFNVTKVQIRTEVFRAPFGTAPRCPVFISLVWKNKPRLLCDDWLVVPFASTVIQSES